MKLTSAVESFGKSFRRHHLLSKNSEAIMNRLKIPLTILDDFVLSLSAELKKIRRQIIASGWSSLEQSSERRQSWPRIDQRNDDSKWWIVFHLAKNSRITKFYVFFTSSYRVVVLSDHNMNLWWLSSWSAILLGKKGARRKKKPIYNSFLTFPLSNHPLSLANNTFWAFIHWITLSY